MARLKKPEDRRKLINMTVSPRVARMREELMKDDVNISRIVEKAIEDNYHELIGQYEPDPTKIVFRLQDIHNATKSEVAKQVIFKMIESFNSKSISSDDVKYAWYLIQAYEAGK
jgi:hypothetical protein